MIWIADASAYLTPDEQHANRIRDLSSYLLFYAGLAVLGLGLLGLVIRSAIRSSIAKPRTDRRTVQRRSAEPFEVIDDREIQ